MTLLADAHGAAIHQAPWAGLLAVVPQCDAVIVDAPYSEKTHAGHDGALAGTGIEDGWTKGNGYQEPACNRRSISYAAWSEAEVYAFVAALSPRCTGWFVTVTDHILAPTWTAALEAQGRYVFAPLPFVAPGSRVRLSGDGPSAWTCWIVVARPRTREYASWGTLPGAYVLPPKQGGRMPVVGGKPIWLGHRLAEDYSRPDGLIVDPCCGAGTFPVGAIRAGRRAVGGDVSAEHAALAAQWVRNPYRAAPAGREERETGQVGLFGG